jgi:uncharacterized lipoprotein YmbA
MSKALLLPVWALLLSGLLAGCSTSPPTNFYLLSAHDFPAATGFSPTVGVGPIEVPEYQNRKNMVLSRDGNKLEVASLNLWAEPVSAGVQRVLVLNLSGLLNTQEVSYFPWHPQRAPQYGVRVNVLQLEANEQQAMLSAEWQVIRTASGEPLQRRISRLQAPLAPGETPPAQVAATYSALLLQLSEQIAAAISSDQARPASVPAP